MWNHLLRYLFSLPVTPSDCDAYFTTSLLPRLDALFQSRARTILLCPCFSVNAGRWYRNVHLLSIDYALRPRLRSRLTLGGRPFPRKPWIFDGKDSHFAFVTYSDILSTDASTCPLGHASPAYSTLPYQPHCDSAASVHGFSPGNLRRGLTRLVSCYALFE